MTARSSLVRRCTRDLRTCCWVTPWLFPIKRRPDFELFLGIAFIIDVMRGSVNTRLASPGAFRDDETELLQFTVDFWGSPVRILFCQAPDQTADFIGDLRPPAARAGPPTPVQPKAGAMPADNGLSGQRVRLGRAMLRPDVRLVILDEPFRGLDREQRRELLGRARKLWRDATLLCIMHNLEETASSSASSRVPVLLLGI